MSTYVEKLECYQLVNETGSYMRQDHSDYSRPLWFAPKFRGENGEKSSGFNLISDEELRAKLEAQFQLELVK